MIDKTPYQICIHVNQVPCFFLINKYSDIFGLNCIFIHLNCIFIFFILILLAKSKSAFASREVSTRRSARFLQSIFSLGAHGSRALK